VPRAFSGGGRGCPVPTRTHGCPHRGQGTFLHSVQGNQRRMSAGLEKLVEKPRFARLESLEHVVDVEHVRRGICWQHDHGIVRLLPI